MNVNVFGIALMRRKTLDATITALTQPAAEVIDTRSEVVQFGEEYSRGSAREGVDGIKALGRDADRNSKMALYFTVPHAALYMLGLVAWDFTSVLKAGATICEIAICFVFPYAVDRLALQACRTLGMRIASPWSKARAFGLLLVALPASMALNFAAPSHIVIRSAAAGLVLMVGLYQVARLVSPSFTKAGKDELKRQAELDEIQRNADAAVAQPVNTTSAASTSRKPDAAELAARKRAKYDELPDAPARAAWTKEYRQKVDAQAAKAAKTAMQSVATPKDLLDAAGQMADAPVSGVPAIAAAA